jgi:hypothetical protein
VSRNLYRSGFNLLLHDTFSQCFMFPERSPKFCSVLFCFGLGTHTTNICRGYQVNLSTTLGMAIANYDTKYLRPPFAGGLSNVKDKCSPLDNLRNFFLTATSEVLSLFQQLREAP